MKRATIGRPCLRDCDALYLPEAGIRELAIKLREKKTREEEREREKGKGKGKDVTNEKEKEARSREMGQKERARMADAKKLSGFANPLRKTRVGVESRSWRGLKNNAKQAERDLHVEL